MEYLTAVTRARKLVQEQKISVYPVDVEAVADNLGFEVVRKALPEGQAGRYVEKDGRKIIVVNETDIGERQRFTILHEIAHVLLNLPSKHGYELSNEDLFSYSKRPPEEMLCDAFAAEVLVPWNLLRPLIDGEPYTINTINALARDFQASRMCTASRFAQSSEDLVIYVLSEDGYIKNVVPSKAVRDAGFWINVGIHLPKESAVHRALEDGGVEAEGEAGGGSWSSSDNAGRYICEESAIIIPKWEQAISMLTLEVDRPARNCEDSDFEEEDELLPELTGELPWRKR